MKRTRQWIALGALAGFLLTAAPALAVTFKLATIAPEGSSWMREMRKGADEIKARTDGRVKIKFRTGGVMGNDRSVIRKIRVGQLDGGAFTAGGFSEVYPDLRLYGLPLLFPSLEEVDRVREMLDPEIIAGLEEAGFISFGFAGGGFALFFSAKPVVSVEQIKGDKMWVPEGDLVSYAGMESLGLSPVTLPITDVLTGLQTGLVDIVSSSPIGAIAFQWHTKVKYFTTTPVVFVPATLVIRKKSFKKLSPEDQAVFREVMVNIYKEIDRTNRIDNQNAYDALISQGLKPVTPSPDELAFWRKKATKVSDKLAKEGLYSEELYNRIKALLASDKAAAATP